MKSLLYLLLFVTFIVRAAFAQPDAPKKLDIGLTCEDRWNQLDALVHSSNQQARYDSAKAFLLHCSTDRHALMGFGDLTAANQGRAGDNQDFVECREFLKTILYLRADSAWYCADVWAIMNTMTYFEGRGYDNDGALAIANYLLSHQRCDSAKLAAGIVGTLANRYEVWRDTVKDSNLTPYPDTVLPSLEDLKLQILEGQPSEVSAPQVLSESPVEVHVTENPFDRTTGLRFTLPDEELIAWKMYDVLGNEVGSNNIGVVLGPGEHRIEIPGVGLSSGTYYVRIAIHGRDPQTVRVIKR